MLFKTKQKNAVRAKRNNKNAQFSKKIINEFLFLR